MEPLAAWELGLSGNGTRHPPPALLWPLHPCCALSVPPRSATIPSQPEGEPGTVAGREQPASPTLDRAQGRLGTVVAWLPWPVWQHNAPQQFPWQQQCGLSSARCGLQKDPLAFYPWRHPDLFPPALAAVSVLLPSARDTMVLSKLPPVGTETHCTTYTPMLPQKEGMGEEQGGACAIP